MNLKSNIRKLIPWNDFHALVIILYVKTVSVHFSLQPTTRDTFESKLDEDEESVEQRDREVKSIFREITLLLLLY